MEKIRRTFHCQIRAVAKILSDVGYDHNYYYHSVKIDRTCNRDHYYYYRVITGTRNSAILRFRTQPPLGHETRDLPVPVSWETTRSKTVTVMSV